MGRKPRPPRRYPSFFKVLLDGFSNNLQIPPAFTKHFNGKISKNCLLCSPAESRYWHVDVENLNNRLFFNKGWKEFVMDHGLELGDFLVFHHLGNSEFHVEVYGKTCCQKKFATANSGKRSISPKFHGEFQNKRSEVEQSHKRNNNGNRDSQTNSDKFEIIDLEAGEPKASIVQHNGEEDELFDHGRSQSRHDSNGKVCNREVRAIEAATKYIPNHPSFNCIMHKAYIMNGFLGIPTSFFRRYMNKQKRGSSVMLEHEGRLWPVKFCSDEKPTAKLSAGWMKFVNENAVKLGDVCVFELVEREGVVLKVIIFRC